MSGLSVAAADQAPQPSHDDAEPSSKQQTQLDADSARAGSGALASSSGSQQTEQDAWQQSKGGMKVRAVDADYSVTTAKTGHKAQAKPADKSGLQSLASNAASSVSQEGATPQQATGMSNQSEASSSAILPPKPKPGAPKARKAPQPALKDAVAGVSQGQGVTPPQPSSGAPQQATPQRPAPQQPQAQGPSSRKPSVQAPAAPHSSLPIYKPAPAAIPLPANSAWAKKLDLQPVSALKSAPIARPTPPPSQPPPTPPAATATQPSQAASPPSSSAVSSTTAPSTEKAAPMGDRPSSAGAKGKGKGKKKGQGQAQSQQAPVAQPSALAPAAPAQRDSAVKEVPAIGNDSRRRASNSTVLTAPGLMEQAPHASAGSQGQLPPFVNLL